jgi:hypothetical protein
LKRRLPFPQLAEKFVQLRGDCPAEFRILLFNYVAASLLRLTAASDFRLAVDCMLGVIAPCDDFLKLTRVVPVLVDLGKIHSALVLRFALFAVLDVLRGVAAIPEALDGYFDHYLKHELHTLCPNESGENVFLVFAELLPLLVTEMRRLQTNSLSNFVAVFSNAFAANNVHIFRVFARSLRAVRHTGGHPVFNIFFYFTLAAFNHPSDEFKQEFLQILSCFYSDATPEELAKYAAEYPESVVPVCQDILTRNPSDALVASVFELFELLFVKGILSGAVAYDLAPAILRFASSSNGLLQYWIQRLLRVIPADAREGMDFWFYFDGPPRVQSRSAVLLSRLSSVEGEQRLIDFDWEGNTHFRTRFMASSRLDAVGITHLVNPGIDNQLIAIDSTNRIRWITLPSDSAQRLYQAQTHMLKETPGAAAGLPSESCFLVGFRNGAIARYDHVKPIRTQICDPNDTRITAIEQLNGPIVLAGDWNGVLTRYDLRAPEPHSFTFQELSVSSLCTWPHHVPLVGVGFSHGVMALLDPRMDFLPVWTDRCPPVRQLLPIAPRCTGFAYLVVNSQLAEIFVEGRPTPRTRSRMVVTYQEMTPFRYALPYRGGALVIDDWSASFIHCQPEFLPMRLFDGTDVPLEVEREEAVWSIQSARQQRQSVHQNLGRITCATSCGDVMVTCDNNGFINRWRIDARPRTSS